MPVFFLLTFTLLFPLAISPEPKVLTNFAAGISWLGLIFSIMLNLDRMFRHDREQGIIEQWLAGGVNVIWFVQARIIAYWLMTGIPIAFTSLVIAFVFSLPANGYVWLFGSQLAGSLVLISLGTFIASLTLSSNRSSMLISVLLIPLLAPVVILGIESVSLALVHANPLPSLTLLIGMALVNMVVAPVLTMIALRNLTD